MTQVKECLVATAVEGKDGFLFLGNDTNRTWDQFEGKLLLSEDDLASWNTELVDRQKLFFDLGIHYRFIIAPNKESVLPDYVPEGVVRGKITILDQIRDLLQHRIHLVDLARVFEHSNRREMFYDRGDSHWSSVGALVATNELLNSLDLFGIRAIENSEVEFWSGHHVGDLGIKLSPPRPSYTEKAKYVIEQSVQVYSNEIVNHGRVDIYRGKLSNSISVMVFGDSFADAIVYWLRQRCSRLVRIHTTSLDVETIVHEMPDIVVSVMVERFLQRPPKSCKRYRFTDDVYAKTRQNSPVAKRSGDEVRAKLSDHDRFYATLVEAALIRDPLD